MKNHETNTSLEVETKPEIPKSREIFTGDINDAVIAVQKITGFEVTPDWWFTNVGNEGTTESILDRFDLAFEDFVYEQMGIRPPEDDVVARERTHAEIIVEANRELEKFDKHFGDDPGAMPLRAEFLDALQDHLKEKYFPSEETVRIKTSGYGGIVNLTHDLATVTIDHGTYPEQSRFQVIDEAPINQLYNSGIRVTEDGSVEQKLPTHQKINAVHESVFGIEPDHLEVTLLAGDTTEIDAQTYWRYLSKGQIPIAGAKDANYFIHDRAVDDHVLGWVVSPVELDTFIQKAGRAIVDKDLDLESVQEAVAAYDFLTSTMTLYVWRLVNGQDAPLPLRGDVNATIEAQTAEAENRLSYAPDAIEQMVRNIERLSGEKLKVNIPSLLKDIETRAQALSAALV